MTDAPSPNSVLSTRHAIGAAVGVAVIVTTYGSAGYGRDGRLWAAPLTLAVAIAMVDVLAEVRRLLPFPGVAPTSVLLVLAAMYLCVPETDQIPVAATVPLVVIGLEVIGRRQVGLEWYGVAAAAVLWAGMFGSTARPSALVGALFAWWAVGLVSVVGLVRPIRSALAAGAVLLIGTAATWAMARTGGIADSGTAAITAAVLAAVVSFVLALVAVHVLDRAGNERDDTGVSATP